MGEPFDAQLARVRSWETPDALMMLWGPREMTALSAVLADRDRLERVNALLLAACRAARLLEFRDLDAAIAEAEELEGKS